MHGVLMPAPWRRGSAVVSPPVFQPRIYEWPVQCAVIAYRMQGGGGDAGQSFTIAHVAVPGYLLVLDVAVIHQDFDDLGNEETLNAVVSLFLVGESV